MSALQKFKQQTQELSARNTRLEAENANLQREIADLKEREMVMVLLHGSKLEFFSIMLESIREAYPELAKEFDYVSTFHTPTQLAPPRLARALRDRGIV